MYYMTQCINWLNYLRYNRTKPLDPDAEVKFGKKHTFECKQCNMQKKEESNTRRKKKWRGRERKRVREKNHHRTELYGRASDKDERGHRSNSKEMMLSTYILLSSAIILFSFSFVRVHFTIAGNEWVRVCVVDEYGSYDELLFSFVAW